MTEHEFDATDPAWGTDPARDPQLAALLRAERLAERIAVATRRQLLRVVPTPWYGHVTRYGRLIASVGIAAAVIAAIALDRTARSESESIAAQGSASATALRSAIASGSKSAITDAVVGPDSTEFLIAMAVDR